jgi:hydroxyacylglutathione hydrolase
MTSQFAEALLPDLDPDVTVLEMRHHRMTNLNYLLVGPYSREAVIVDPAWQMDKIDRALGEAGAALKGVLITHSHADHIHLARPLADKYDCPIFMSREEIAASGYRGPRLVDIDETPWTVGEMLIEPIVTPGHTPGSTCYLIADNLFTGDVLFAEGAGMCSDTQSAHAMFASLERLKQLAPYTRVFPAHSYGQAPGQLLSRVRRDNPFLQFNDPESFASFRLTGRMDKGRKFNFA